MIGSKIEIRVLVIKSANTPYRVDFFNELGKYVNLDVLYEYKKAIDRDESWSNKHAINYNEFFMKYNKIYKKLGVGFGFQQYLKRNYDIIIISEYTTLTSIIIEHYMKKKNMPFIINADGGIIKLQEKK